MPWKSIVTLCALACLCAPRVAQAQPWTSADVGAVAIAGTASQAADGTWTVQGSGADIWGTADSFQFVHQTSTDFGAAQATVVDLQNTNTFAKAGVMVRSSLSAGAATAILDKRPTGDIEFMVRATDGGPMSFIATTTRGAGVRLTWAHGVVRAFTGTGTSGNWELLAEATLTLPATTHAGMVVTSHDQTQLATAHFANVSPVFQPPAVWNSMDVGNVGQPGGAVETNGVWTVTGAGGDIWGTADAFQFLFRSTTEHMSGLKVRIDDMQNTNGFAKAGIMVRQGLEPDAPCVILNVTPGGHVEFMARQTRGGEMQFVAGTTVTFPVWLSLGNAGGSGLLIDLVPGVSQDGVHFDMGFSPSRTLPTSSQYYAGAAITSHDTGVLNTVHLRGLSLNASNFDIGDPGLIGAVAAERTITVEGAGADIWGTADSFEFVGSSIGAGNLVQSYRILSLSAAHPFAKGGLMFRDGLSPNAASVILDAKPDGGVEFMARLCGGCETTFVGGTTITFPAYLTLTKNGSTFTAQVSQTEPFGGPAVGSVVVPMPSAFAGLAVTSHDTSQIATAVFEQATR
jgi:hypothetical protein